MGNKEIGDDNFFGIKPLDPKDRLEPPSRVWTYEEAVQAMQEALECLKRNADRDLQYLIECQKCNQTKE